MEIVECAEDVLPPNTNPQAMKNLGTKQIEGFSVMIFSIVKASTNLRQAEKQE